MRKNLLKKITATVLTLSMVVGLTGVVSAAHAANGANVATVGGWTSFSICTREDGGVWEDALKNIRSDAFPNGQKKGVDYATEGYITPNVAADHVEFFVKSVGWDAEYDPLGNKVADNPYGMWIQRAGIPIEHGRTYTVSFKIKSTLHKDEKVDKDTGEVISPEVRTKHVSFKAVDPNAKEGGVEFVTISGADASPSGMLTLETDVEHEIKAVIKIPETKYNSDEIGFKFFVGAYDVTYQEESAMTNGYINISDFKVIAGDQYQVSYTNGTDTQSKYVNKDDTVASINLPKKGYTLTGYKTVAGAYTFGTPVTSDLQLTAVYVKTAKPAKPKVTTKSGKKKISVKIKPLKNAVGYEIQYSYKKNMKKAKKKDVITAKSYTIKKLKSRKYVYVKVRAYTRDSALYKVYGKLSARKKVYVK